MMDKNNREEIKSGRYHNDYSPRYQKPYDIYDKAKQHIIHLKKESYQKESDNSSDNSH
ncbi:MAG: hypothetical protein MR410_04355 [Eubacterium sp.]|nr:hypothetical protein [Eubacterium sp.]